MILSSDQNPLFRKAILPWYDTDVACVLTGVFLLAVLAFSLTGVSVALEMPEGGKYVWVPGVLVALSAIGVITISLRLLRRHAQKSKKELP